ncbi:MAG: aminotransferase class I/II-fold pyridoxal phosphate-dependent enzyme [Microbacteriaceae bacterium]
MKVEAASLSQLRTRTSEKWREYPDHVLPLFVAELDVALAEPIAQALQDAIARSDTGYAARDTELPEAFASFAAARWNWSVDPARVSSTADISMVIVESLRLAIKPGDAVVLNPPVYAPFFDLIPEAGGRVIEVPLREPAAGDGAAGGGADGAWSLDLDGLQRAFADGARAYLLCNPHNPLGLVHSADELRAVAELAERYDVTVISDEVHGPLTHLSSPSAGLATGSTLTPPVFTPFLSVSDAAREHGIAAASASKAWNVAGLKCALFVTASDRMTRLLAALPEEVHFRTGIFGRIANAAAFGHGGQWLDGLLRLIEGNRSLLTRLLTEHLPEVGYREPQASYLAWLDFRALGWGDNPSSRALRAAGVALTSGPAFGAQGRGFARLNFGCSPEVLTDAVGRLAAAR